MSGRLCTLMCTLFCDVIAFENHVSPGDCYVITNNGSTEYMGTISSTEEGLTCQNWDQNIPHNSYFHLGPEHVNYCRNPDKSARPWCYTTDPSIRWQYCRIPQCGDVNLPAPNNMKHRINNEAASAPSSTSDKTVVGAVIGVIVIIAMLATIALFVIKRTRGFLSPEKLSKTDAFNENKIGNSIERHERPANEIDKKVLERAKISHRETNPTNRYAIGSDEYNHISFVTNAEDSASRNYDGLHFHVTRDLYDVSNSKSASKTEDNENYDHFVNKRPVYENTSRFSNWVIVDENDCSKLASEDNIYQNA